MRRSAVQMKMIFFLQMHCNFHFDLPELAKVISHLSKDTKYVKRGVMG